jgi:hypothetical protein
MNQVQEIMQQALRGARIRHLEICAHVQIDDILALSARWGRYPTPEEIANLERRMGQQAASHWRRPPPTPQP